MSVFPFRSKIHKDMGQITEGQRYTISVMRARGCKQKEIAERIGKDKSVVCRELKRNGSPKTGKYTLTSSSPLLLGIAQASLGSSELGSALAYSRRSTLHARGARRGSGGCHAAGDSHSRWRMSSGNTY